jgi:hypothetical protein
MNSKQRITGLVAIIVFLLCLLVDPVFSSVGFSEYAISPLFFAIPIFAIAGFFMVIFSGKNGAKK